MKLNKKIRKEVIEWSVFIGIIVILYITGLHTSLIGTLQRGILATGIIAPDTEIEKSRASYHMTLVDLEGNSVDLADWKSETIFLNFWATWCPPCIAEMPDINSLYVKTGEEVKFAIISVDEDRQKARDFVARKGFTMPIYFLKSGIPGEYASEAIPTTFVISPEGQIVVRNKGMAKYDSEKFRSFLLNL